MATDAVAPPGVWERLFGPIDPRSLVVFRMAFGILLGILVARYFLHGWIDAQFHEPRHFFPWIPGARPWPRPWMHVHFAALGALGLFIAAGFLYRPSCLLFALGFGWVHLLDKTNYLNHYYLITLLAGLLAFLPLGRVASVDVRLGWARPAGALPGWVPAILRFQVGAVYFFAGVAKLQGDWLLRAQPLRIWLAETGLPLLDQTWIAYAASWGSAAFDLLLPFLLLARRTRLGALGAAALFHAATAVLFPLGLFPWVMTACLLVFLPGRPPSATAVPAPSVPPPAARAALVLYALFQLAFPLRHLLFPGEVLWTERGFRFSWRVMVAEKRGESRFFARDPATGRAWEVPVAELLTPVQLHYMATQPDMVRDFARLVRAEHGAPLEVRADVRVSMNGRPARPLVDPSVDLAGPISGPGWILPRDDVSAPAPHARAPAE